MSFESLIAPYTRPSEEIRRLGHLGWPVIVGQIGLVGMGTVDMLVVGRMGSAPLAALGIGNVLSWAVMSLGIGCALGFDPFFTRAYGKGQPKEAGVAFVRAAWLMAMLALPMMAWHLSAGHLLTLFRQPAEIHHDATLYTVILAGRVPALLVFALARQLIQGKGIMRLATWVILWGNVANVITDVWWVYGGLGVPAFGVAGAAWSTLLVQWLMAGTLLYWARDHLREALAGVSWKPVWPDIFQTAKTALPAALQVGIEAWAFNAISVLAGLFGSVALAAHTLAFNVVALTFMVPLGLSSGTTTRIGNLVGAEREWRPSAWLSVLLCTLFMVFTAIVYTLFPGFIARLYTEDAAVIAVAITLLPIAALFQLADGLQISAASILRGLGDTQTAMRANLIAHWMIGLPVGVFLSFGLDWGLTGLWVGITIGLAVTAVLLIRAVLRAEVVDL
jgi:MATE family multidrug resistance protein